jgi:hypothetical protein
MNQINNIFKRIVPILLCATLISGCSNINEHNSHKEQSLFKEKSISNNYVEEDIAITELAKLEEVKIKPHTVISEIEGKDKLQIVSNDYPEFYGQLYKALLNYEQGKIKDFIDIFYPYSVQEEFLFTRYVDAQIAANTKINITNTYFYNDKLTIDLIIEYIPTFCNILKNGEKITDITSDYEKYSKISPQKDSFSITFDILKYSSSEGVKIKDYGNKHAILRALTNGFYGVRKEIIEHSKDNYQDEINKLLNNLKSLNLEELSKDEKISDDFENIILENPDLSEFIYKNIDVISVNKDYLLITYPNIKTYIIENSPSAEDLLLAINEDKIESFSILIYDPDFSNLYKFINNMFL